MKSLKIDYRRIYILLYKVTWLDYETTEKESDWLSISKLTYTSDLIADFHKNYLEKPSILMLTFLSSFLSPLNFLFFVSFSYPLKLVKL